MDWILSLLLIWNAVTAAADEQAKAEALQAALIAQAEAAMYEGNTQVDSILASEWALLPETVFQGDAVLVRSQTEAAVQWHDKSYPLLSYGKGYYTLLPIPMDMKPGTYRIGDRELTVKKKKFETQYLEVTEEQESMRQNTDRINKDQQKINKARSQSAADFLYKHEFIQPIEGILTTPYGYTRYVNGTFSGSHRAIDLAAPEGTPIKATNDGVVVLSEALYLTGNSIYIDHGMNLFSQYAHLSELKVKAGDKVKAGQTIGLVGTTGFSTGPHLHFTFWIGNDPVNPNLFFNKTPFQWSPPEIK